MELQPKLVFRDVLVSHADVSPSAVIMGGMAHTARRDLAPPAGNDHLQRVSSVWRSLMCESISHGGISWRTDRLHCRDREPFYPTQPLEVIRGSPNPVTYCVCTSVHTHDIHGVGKLLCRTAPPIALPTGL